MKTLILAAIRCSLMFLVTASPFFLRPAQAFTMTMEQMGSNVVATGSGAFNLTGLDFDGSGQAVGNGIQANLATIFMSPGLANMDQYTGFTGPTSFGSGGFF